MTVLYPDLCYNKEHHKGTALYKKFLCYNVQITFFHENIVASTLFPEYCLNSSTRQPPCNVDINTILSLG